MTEEEKGKALDFLYYEIWMFNEIFSQLCHVYAPLNKCVIVRNALLECFLLHARNLIYFLKDKSEKWNDIRCSHFEVKKQNIELPENNGVDEINKYLAHLTKRRVWEDKPEWNCPQIRQEINDKLTNFFNKLDSNIFPTKKGRREQSFRDLLSSK